MGDKTQLATISLAVEYNNMLNVLMGTTLAMVIADAVGIIVGIAMRKHIPEKIVKWMSAVIFVFFGLSGVHKILSAQLNLLFVRCIILILIACTTYGAYRLSK